MADMLATPEDLASFMQQDLDLSTATLVLEMATAKVQRAAGGQRILQVTDTAVVDGVCDYWLELPQRPIQSVATVAIDGTAVTDWALRSQRLWRAAGWMVSWSPPSQVAVVYTHGYTAGSQWLQLARDSVLALGRLGYGNPSAATSEKVDDYAVTYAEADARMQMTEFMRDAIATAYGSLAYVTESRC